jgi:hypothetical protein
LTDRHRQVLRTLADEGTIDAPNEQAAALLDDLVDAGLAVERKPRLANSTARGCFTPTRRGRSLAVRLP